jgi:hypothetical protein
MVYSQAMAVALKREEAKLAELQAELAAAQFMPPLILTPEKGGKWKMTGGFDVEAVLEVCDPRSRRDRV